MNIDLVPFLEFIVTLLICIQLIQHSGEFKRIKKHLGISKKTENQIKKNS